MFCVSKFAFINTLLLLIHGIRRNSPGYDNVYKPLPKNRKLINKLNRGEGKETLTLFSQLNAQSFLPTPTLTNPPLFPKWKCFEMISI